MPADRTFAEAFERLRLARGWSPAEVARQLGVYPTEVSRWRRGRGGISIRNVRKVADLFGVDPATLEVLAGYASAASGTTEVDAERQQWGTWYQHLIENKIPRSMWSAYTRACDALADVFKLALPPQDETPLDQDFGNHKIEQALPQRPARRRYESQSVASMIARNGFQPQVT